MSETVVSQTAKILRASAPGRHNAHPSENIVLLGQSTAVYTIILAEGLPESADVELSSHVKDAVVRMPFYSPVRSGVELTSWFAKNRQLNHNLQLYLESLTYVSVSNKDISNRIGKALDLQNLIVFQVDRWPCSDCMPPLRIRLKMRAIDLPSGLIVWTGINELEVDRPEEASMEQLIELSDELLTQFQKRFERKWHRKRLYNLTQLARK